MSGSFHVGDSTVSVSNSRLESLVAFGLEVASSMATMPDTHLFVKRFEAQTHAFLRGIDLDLDELFPTAAEKTFWASVYAELSARIELGEIGNPDSADWRSSVALQAQQIAEMLRAGARASDLCERIVEARSAVTAIVRIEPASGMPAQEAAARLGIGGGASDNEISESHARAILCALLVEDMAYRTAIVPLEEAVPLADAFISRFHDSGTRYFTNATWIQAKAVSRHGNPLELRGWLPATSHTFDSGVLIVGKDLIGCAWFGDED